MMSAKDAKSFKVPKIKREESKDNLRQVEITSRDCIEIVNIVKRSYLDSSFEPAWQLKTAALVENRELEAQYRAKKAELKEEGRNARDLIDHFAFIIQRDNTIVPYIVKDGLKCKSVYQSLLGNCKLGVYVWRNADIQLRLAENWKVPSCTLIVFKVVLGKCKVLAQQNGEENIEPTPNYDCHVPQCQPRPSENFNIQLARSQVYLYEYTEDCEPSQRPRQCLPYAVLTYEKIDNVPRSLTAKVDSYSKRPKSSWSSDIDTVKPVTVKVAGKKRDPRLGKVQSKLNAGEWDLCMPCLTPGPPRGDLNVEVVNSVSDPDDPRSQLSFLASSSNQTYNDLSYQPSFGPSDSDEVGLEYEEITEQEPLTSLPPIKLPLLPDPLLPPNSQLDTRYTDPRFGYVDAYTSDVPSDPRLRPADPRLQSIPIDPRLRQMQLDPRKQQALLNQRPQIKQAELTYQQPYTQEQNIQEHQRISNSQGDDASKTRKKLSLSDYKKKVNIAVFENSVEKSSTDLGETQKENVTAFSDVQQGLSKQPVTYTQVISTSISKDRDPRLSQKTNYPGMYSQSTSCNEKRDPRLSKEVSNQPDSQANFASICEQRDPRLFSQSSINVSQHNRSNLENPAELAVVEASSIGIESIQNTEDDIVDGTDDMAKTLNELSDPDDISQSPKHFEEPVLEDPKIDDPMLAAAMQKLVEHSGNVILFTEALRMLQESAEEFGDQLTDPEFLVKKIAEKIEELSKLEEHKLSNSLPSVDNSMEIQEIDSPEIIMSPDISNDSKSDMSTPVKHIPLENVDMDIEVTEKKSDSKIDEAMKKTLEELERIEKSQSAKPLKTRKNSSRSKNKHSKKQSSFDRDLLDIPIPPEPPKQTKSETTTATEVLQAEQQKEPFEKKKLETKMKVDIEEDDDEDLRITQILPSLKEQQEIKKKSVISFNFKRNMKPSETVFEHSKNDVDLRDQKNVSTSEKNFKNQEVSKEKEDFGLVDEDFRKKTEKKKNEKKENTSILDIFTPQSSDVDERKNTKKQDINKGIEITSARQTSSISKFVDPFGLEHEISDKITSESSVIEKKDVNDFGDIDWRHVSGAPVDVDMRSTDTSAENSQCSELGDFDLRHSHSRSVSPTPGILSSSKENAHSQKQSFRKFVDPFGLDEDTDERLISRSNSPIPAKESGTSLGTKEVTPDNTTNSNSESGALFDAYSMGKSNSDSITHASNEYGDIDWRQAAAAEMGDVDLRHVPVEIPKSSNRSQATHISSATDSVLITASVHNADPFQQMNKNLQSMFRNTSQAVPQYQISASPYGNYSTSNTASIYESYTTSKSSGSDNCNTKAPHEKTELYSYTPTSSHLSSQNQEGIHNIIQNLDFSNLKNILANVQTPSAMEAAETTEMQEESEKPAFVTGLTAVKSLTGESRKFGTPVSRQNTPTKKQSSQMDTVDSQEPLMRIPGFDISPEKDINETSKNTEKTDSPSSEEGKSYRNSKPKEYDSSINESLPSTPKVKEWKDSEDVMTPLPNISYQAAILESIEQSALKVRNEDSFTSEVEESPIRRPKKEKSKHKKLYSETKSVGIKRSHETSDMNVSHKMMRKENDRNKTKEEDFDASYDDDICDDDDDDEESGLVIDLSPGVKTEQIESPAVNQNDQSDILDLTDDTKPDHIVNSSEVKPSSQPENVVDLTSDAEPVIIIDNEVENKTSDNADLQEEDAFQAKSKDEMTGMIEKSRKNMVIKLKGQTKLVNPKTGKAYDEDPKGSAIEVLGQKSNPAQQIHPIHGIVSVNSQQTSATSSDTSVCTAQSSLQFPQIPESLVQMSPASTLINSSILPVPVISHMKVGQQQTKPLGYVHPYSGKTITYGQPSQTPVHPTFGNSAGSESTIPMPEAQPVLASASQIVPLAVPPSPVLSVTARPALIVPCQNQLVSVQAATVPPVLGLPLLPVGIEQQGPGIPVQQFGTPLSQQVQVSNQEVRSQIKTLGNVTQPSLESKPSTDVFDCFRDKFERKETKPDQKTSEAKSVPKADMKASDTKNAYSVKLFLEDIEMKARKELSAQTTTMTTAKMMKTENVFKQERDDAQTVGSGNASSRKRLVDEEIKASPLKKIKSETDLKAKLQRDFGSMILESLTEVKSKLRSPEKSSPSPEKQEIKPKLAEITTEETFVKDESKTQPSVSGASSELEDGEISEDSVSDSEEPVVTDKNVSVMQTGSRIPVLGARPGPYNRNPARGSWQHNFSSRSVNFGNQGPIRQNTPNIPYRVGTDWADTQNPEKRSVERVRTSNIETPSLKITASTSLDDTARIVSKSAASISKSRQKYKAQSQVKTLGEWLKLELEIDNIAPLQSIIPYDLDTDLTKIPKQRKRRIRMKVKNAIEQEGTKAVNFERKEPVTVEVVLSENEVPKPLHPNYLPEVSNEQIEKELQMIGISLNLMKERLEQQSTLNSVTGNPFQIGQFTSFQAAEENKKMIVAMTLVESEMRTHISRTCFYGYPHRRVPDELLLFSELGGFKSEAEDVFLILMMPLSAKPYNKLLQLKKSLVDLFEKKNCISNPADLAKIDEEIKLFHSQRQAVLRGFTGYLNKKRIQKLQETVEKYTLVHDYFKMKTPPTPDSLLRFIRTTQLDLRQHLILARQYLALEEQKLQ